MERRSNFGGMLVIIAFVFGLIWLANMVDTKPRNSTETDRQIRNSYLQKNGFYEPSPEEVKRIYR